MKPYISVLCLLIGSGLIWYAVLSIDGNQITNEHMRYLIGAGIFYTIGIINGYGKLRR